MKQHTAAVITIKNVPAMTPKGRKQIADWLRRHAAALIREGADYTGSRFTGRYLYTDNR